MRQPIISQQQVEMDAFDLDIEIVESGPRLDDLLNLTGDNCGATCASACNSCP